MNNIYIVHYNVNSKCQFNSQIDRTIGRETCEGHYRKRLCVCVCVSLYISNKCNEKWPYIEWQYFQRGKRSFMPSGIIAFFNRNWKPCKVSWFAYGSGRAEIRATIFCLLLLFPCLVLFPNSSNLVKHFRCTLEIWNRIQGRSLLVCMTIMFPHYHFQVADNHCNCLVPQRPSFSLHIRSR